MHRAGSQGEPEGARASETPTRGHRHTRFVFPEDGMGWRCTHRLNLTSDGLGQGVEYSDAQGNTLTLSVYPSPVDGDGPQRLSLPDELRQVTEDEVYAAYAEDADPLVLIEYTVGRNAREPILRMLWGMGPAHDDEAVPMETLLAIFDLGSWRYRVLYVGEAGPTGTHEQVLRQVAAFAFDIDPDDFTPVPAEGLPDLGLPSREPCGP